MKLGISNLAWDPKDDLEIVKILHEGGVKYLDICPMKYFTPTQDNDQLISVKNFWEQNGIMLHGAQALFFGLDINLIGSPDKVLSHFTWLISVAKTLGISVLTFGAPQVRAGCTPYHVDIFKRIGDLAAGTDISICVEPVFGQEFCGNSNSTYEFVESVQHQNIKMQIDIGSMIQNNELTLDWCRDESLIGHVHISRPGLAKITENMSGEIIQDLITKKFPDSVLTIEMLPNTYIRQSIQYTERLCR